MSEKTHTILWKEDDELFEEELPSILDDTGISQEELKELLQRLAVEISLVEFRGSIFRKYAKFGMLIMTSIGTVLIGVGLWLSVFLKLQVSIFMILFFGLMLLEGVMFIGGLYAINIIIGFILNRSYTNIQVLLVHQCKEKYGSRGVEMELIYSKDDRRVIPSIRVRVFNANDPWKKFPAIYL